MRKANAIRAIIFVVIIAGFLFGLLKLFFLRFESGDVFPAYSSLRSDPLGSRALYSSLENLNDAVVSRNYRPLQDLEFSENSAFFYIGTPVFDSDSVSAEWFKVFEQLTNSGGRLVMSFLPLDKKPANWRMSKCRPSKEKAGDKEKGGQKAASGNSEKQVKPHTNDNPLDASNRDDKKLEERAGPFSPDAPSGCVALREKWGLAFAFAEKVPDKAARVREDSSAARLKGLPREISWHTALYFDQLDENWQVIYTADSRPVIVERPYGKGSLVLSADSFFLSNEALRSERHPGLLVWVLGQSSEVVFDETHFGIFKHPGVLSLIKKYRFHWFIFAVAVLALLFIWKNSVYFVPPAKKQLSQPDEDFISDRDFTQGLISLLRRNIPVRQLLQACTREWERTMQPGKRIQNEQLAQIKSALQTMTTRSPKSMDPVAAYRRISKIISKGRYDE